MLRFNYERVLSVVEGIAAEKKEGKSIDEMSFVNGVERNLHNVQQC